MAELKTLLQITVCTSPKAGVTHEALLELPCGSTVAQALTQAAKLLQLELELGTEQLTPSMIGIWGKTARGEQLLKNGDRLEIYRPLTVDPKVARRERFARQGARSSGLFKRQRPGAKAGY
ncbi:RnfH family protein [Comamonas sp. Y33R10-2]|uniref:RnfH family protein n=1 Tax=Comamonas sp. Y33R10-2 TaxID=2853257 RepID=UPI001C5CBB07|nr:RnfH family protein [Comamonas sp. Y33R10-2]QXZ10790.1 RnfH family protein [Comamonas sp. Y33R10-2]